MHAITIGRSSQNDVVINDRNVSRVHCQIIQDDTGNFRLLDFGSTNGTFVNGRKIIGEIRLNSGDTIRVGNTTLPWQPYFSKQSMQRNNYTVAWILGAIGTVVAILIIMGCFLYFTRYLQRDIIFSGEYPPVKTITYTEGDEKYEIEAVEGQVIVISNNSISHSQAVNRIRRANGKIISQFPNIRYYLVDVGAVNEFYFIEQIKQLSNVDFVGLNSVEYTCGIERIVLDNFYSEDGSEVLHGKGNHGDKVVHSYKECGNNANVSSFNVGDKDGKSMINSEIDSDLIANLENNKAHSKVINMSFGPAFIDSTIHYWSDIDNLQDKKRKDEIKNAYRDSYKKGLERYLAIASKYDEQDFVIVKASGNEGLKNLDGEILHDFYQDLSPDKRVIFNKHFILASAEDTRWNTYSNETSKYSSLNTKIDVSDLYYNGKALYGTSFAAPRLSCYISSLAEEYNIKATDANEIVKNITQIHGDNIVRYEDIRKEAEAFANYQKLKISNRKSQTIATDSQQTETYSMRAVSEKPNIEKIKRDLIGRKITEQPNGYHFQGWYWLIEVGEIKDIHVVSEKKQGNDYLFEVRLILQADGGAHEALINLNYVLRQNGEWTIDFLESKQINIVKTGQYNSCVTFQRQGWSGEYYLELTNHCDVALVVGGVVLSEFGGEWRKFSTVVNASETSSVGGLFTVSVIDYQIHFVERP